MASTDTSTELQSPGPGWTPAPVVDWIAAAIIAVVGLVFTIGGATLTLVVDQRLLAETVTPGELTVLVYERQLTRAETADLAGAVVDWTGVGLLVAGIGLVAFAIAYVLARRRSAGAPGALGAGWAAVVLGAVVTTVASFLPASPVFGGALAGYLTRTEPDTAVRSGALSGVAATLPLVVVLLFVAVGLSLGLTEIGAGGLGVVTVIALLLGALVAVAVSAALGALGGYAGGRLADRRGAGGSARL
jgi:hypothetical protein